MNTIDLGPMDGKEVAPGVFLVGEPTPIPGTNKLRCLANWGGSLAVVELALKFAVPLNASEQRPLACAGQTSGTALDA